MPSRSGWDNNGFMSGSIIQPAWICVRTAWRSPFPTISSASGSGGTSPGRFRKRPTKCWAARSGAVQVVPELFEVEATQVGPTDKTAADAAKTRGHRRLAAIATGADRPPAAAAIAARCSTDDERDAPSHPAAAPPRIETFVVGAEQSARLQHRLLRRRISRRAIQPAVHPRQLRPGQNPSAAGPLPAIHRAPSRPSAGCI